MLASQRLVGIGAVIATALSLAGCSDRSSPVSPSTPIANHLSSSAQAAVSQQYFEIPVSFDGPLDAVACVDPQDPPFAHVNGTVQLYVLTSPSGVVSTRNYFNIDRANTWVIYKGVTYYIAQGRPGKDDISHILQNPNGLYVEAGVEPDFEASGQPGQRLQLNFHWQIVIDPNGNARVSKSTGTCPWTGI